MRRFLAPVARFLRGAPFLLSIGISGFLGANCPATPAKKPLAAVITAGDLAPVSEMEWETLPTKIHMLGMVMVDRKTGASQSPVAVLHLSASQIMKINQLQGELIHDSGQTFVHLQQQYKAGQLTMEQKNGALRELALTHRIVVSTAMKKWLSATQFDRLQELEMLFIIDKRRGPIFMKRLDALERPELQAELALTPTQQKRMKAALKSARDIMRAPVDDPTQFDPLAPGALENAQQQQQRNFDRALDPILHILTPAQCKRLGSLFQVNYSFIPKKSS